MAVAFILQTSVQQSQNYHSPKILVRCLKWISTSRLHTCIFVGAVTGYKSDGNFLVTSSTLKTSLDLPPGDGPPCTGLPFFLYPDGFVSMGITGVSKLNGAAWFPASGATMRTFPLCLSMPIYHLTWPSAMLFRKLAHPPLPPSSRPDS